MCVLQEALDQLRRDLESIRRGADKGATFWIDMREGAIHTDTLASSQNERDNATVLLARMLNGSGTMANLRSGHYRGSASLTQQQNRTAFISALEELAGRVTVEGGSYTIRTKVDACGMFASSTRARWVVFWAILVALIGAIVVLAVTLKRAV